MEHVLLLFAAQRIAELFLQEPQERSTDSDSRADSFFQLVISATVQRIVLGITRAALLDDALLHHRC